MGAGKPKGIRAGRKLKTTRRLQRYIIVVISDGQAKISIKDYLAQDSKTPSWAAVWPRDSLLKRSVYNQNSQTPPSERVLESCLRKTVKRLLPSSHGMVVSTIWPKTTKSWSLVSVKRVDQKVIFRVSVSKLLPLKESHSSLCLQERKKRNDSMSFIITSL